jgi:hypothetical protein
VGWGLDASPASNNPSITVNQLVLPVSFLRTTLLPAAIVLLFGLALFAVSARIWLPGDMASPASGG